jgi:hypothetical protein
MPRFSIKLMLIAFAVVAVWLSTATGYLPGGDIRSAILLLAVVAAGLKAWYSAGREKAFWLGFFAVMLVMAYTIGTFAPRLMWVSNLVERNEPSDDLFGPPTVPAQLPVPYPTDAPNPPPETTPPPIPPAPVPLPPPQTLFDIFGQDSPLSLAEDSIRVGLILILATLAGCIGLYIYDQSRSTASPTGRGPV